VNLRSHHRTRRVLHRMRRALVALNSPGAIYDYPRLEVAQARIVFAVMRTRRGLNGPKAARMVLALWECDD
jgi:hypothetical protein